MLNQVAQTPRLTIREVATTPVAVPMKIPLATSAATIRSAPLLLVDLKTDEGVTGRSYVFCYRVAAAAAIDALLKDAVDLIKGQSLVPAEAAAFLARRLTLLGVTGVARMALSAVDIALWDAAAISANVSLAALLGGERTVVSAYNSNGLGFMEPTAAAEEAPRLLARGFKGVKARLGHSDLAQDLAVVRAIRKRLPDDVALMVDYNQALSVDQAMQRGQALQNEGIAWLEEPTRHDDLSGNATIARALTVSLQLGENFDGPDELAAALESQACDLIMPDVARIGGVTGWIEGANIAAARGVQISSHLFPEVSAHLLAASPTAHWLEYVDWAEPILAQPLEIINGAATVPMRPGIGFDWDQAKVKEYRIT
jgi:mandelate racemase